MSTAARVVAHAKLNLLLHVLDRRSDGYHDIATWLVRLALGDDVVVRVRPSGRGVECRGADVGPPERNLALRAAEAYVEAARWPAGFAIEIDKRIPVGGGLGGGSADAGAVLHGEVERAARAAQINTFGGGVVEVLREIVATAGLGMARQRR